MPRKRMISPEIWRDPKFVTLSDDTTRLLFIGLFSNANDYGKLRGEWWNVRSEIFVTNELSQNKINMMLEELEQKKLITRYKVKNEQYIKLASWQKHQKVSHPAKDEYPEPPKDNPPETLRTPSGDPPSQVRLGKVRLGKVRLGKEKLDENSKRDPPEAQDTKSDIRNLLSQFPAQIKTLIDEYIQHAKDENKTKTITPQKERRLINELHLVWTSCDCETLEDDFEKALKIAVNNQAPNVNYVRKVMKSIVKKRSVRLKKANQIWK